MTPRPLSRRASILLGGVAALAAPSAALAQLRVVDYNLAQSRAGVSTVLEQLGRERVAGIAKAPDVFTFQEQTTSGIAGVVATLNAIYGANSYVAAPFVGQSTGSGLPVMVYRPDSVSLIGTKAVGVVSTSANARQTARYQIRPVGYGPDADVYLYNSHYKASTGGSNAARRLAEATSNRADADALGPGRNVIYAGDFNFYSGNESGYQKLVSPGNARAVDPVSAPLNWSGSANRIYHTQSPATGTQYPGQVTGGMNDRFDFQLSTAGVQDGEGVALIPGTYRVFGNNGTHALGGAINVGNGWSPAGLTASPQAVLNDLARASDHVPLVADYQVPAVLSAGGGGAGGRVIVGANVAVPVAVRNAAGVVASNGADELDWQAVGTGGVVGSASGVAAALAAPTNVAGLRLDTSAPGRVGGAVSVTTTSEAAANPSVTLAASADVLAHARPSLAAGSVDSARTVDLGVVALGSRPRRESFALYNLPAASAAFTAALDLDRVTAAGDAGFFASDLAAFAGLAAGDARAFTASVNTASLGAFAADLALDLSDEDLPGASSLGRIVVSLAGRVAIGGDATLDGAVDAADLAVLGRTFGAAGAGVGFEQGDFDRNGRVDALDVRTLALNWTSPDRAALAAFLSGGLPVPEPAGAAVLIGAAGLLARRRRA